MLEFGRAMMDNALQEFSAIGVEVVRVLRSPYTPSLQALHRTLDRASSSSIRAWLGSNECSVEPLAHLILGSFQINSSTVKSLLRLVTLHDTFRQACVSHMPDLLATCLDQTLQGGKFQSQYQELCIALLSKIGGQPLPAQALPFLNRFVRDFTKNPDCPSLSSALSLLHSANITWPLDCLEGIQATTMRVLREGHEDEGISLLCLAILAALSQNAQLNEVPRTQCQDFFAGKKASKSLVLGITSCIKSLSAHVDGSRGVSDTAEHFRLAGMVFDAVQNKQAIVLDRTTCLFTRKLCEKLQRDGLEQDVQIAGASALQSLLEDKLPQTVIDLVSHIALQPQQPISEFDAMADRFVPRFGDNFVSTLLRQSLHDCIEGKLIVSECLNEPHVAGLIACIQQLISKHPRLRDSVRKTFAEPEMQDLLLNLIQSDASHIEAACKKETISLGLQLPRCSACADERSAFNSLRICQLLLLGCPDTNMQLSSLAVDYIARADTRSGTRCGEHFGLAVLPRRPAGVTRKFETPAHVDSNRWQDKLHTALQQNALAQSDQLANFFQSVCIDLERRCNEVEEPLHEKELIISDQRATIDSLRAALSQQQQERQTVSEENRQLHQQTISLTEELQDLRSTSEQNLHEYEQERDRLGHSLQSEIATRQKSDSDHRVQSESLQCELEKRLGQCSALEHKVHATVMQLSTSQHACCSLSERCKSLEADNANLREQNAGLLSSNDDIRRELQEVKSAHDESHKNVQIRISEIKGLEATLEERSALAGSLQDEKNNLVEQLTKTRQRVCSLEQDMIAQNDRLTTTKEQELSDQSIFYDQALDQLRLEVQHTTKTASLAAQHHQDAMQDLKLEIKALRQDKERRTKELAQAQQLGRQLMGLMQQAPDSNGCALTPRKINAGEVSTDTLSSMLDETQVSASEYSQIKHNQPEPHVPVSSNALKLSPVKRRAGRRALSELPPQSPRKAKENLRSVDRRTSWAPHHHKRRASGFQTTLRDENMLERSFYE